MNDKEKKIRFNIHILQKELKELSRIFSIMKEKETKLKNLQNELIEYLKK